MVVILQVFDTFGPVKEAIIFNSCQLPGSCGHWDWRNTSSLRSRWGSTFSLPYRLTLSPSSFTPSPLHTLDLLALCSLPCFFTAPHSSPSHTSSHPTLFPLPHILTPHTLLPLSNMHLHTHTHFCHPHILTTAHSSLPHILTPTLCYTLDPPSPSHPHPHTLLPHSTSHARAPTLSTMQPEGIWCIMERWLRNSSRGVWFEESVRWCVWCVTFEVCTWDVRCACGVHVTQYEWGYTTWWQWKHEWRHTWNMVLIGASVSEPHTDNVYIYICRTSCRKSPPARILHLLESCVTSNHKRDLSDWDMNSLPQQGHSDLETV